MLSIISFLNFLFQTAYLELMEFFILWHSIHVGKKYKFIADASVEYCGDLVESNTDISYCFPFGFWRAHFSSQDALERRFQEIQIFLQSEPGQKRSHKAIFNILDLPKIT